jgi:deoxyribonuclease V
MNFELPKNLSDAIKLQKQISKKVVVKDIIKKINYVCGIDVHYKDNEVILGYIVVSYPKGEVVEQKLKIFPYRFTFPYIPEFLCFLEGPYIIEFLKKLNQRPDILILDGHGIAHPRQCGLASYVGVVGDIATIGCAKKILYGKYSSELGLKRGSYVNIIDEITTETIGYALRTKDNVKEIIVSVGHKISLDTAKNVVLTLSKYRIPQPLRLAHSIAKIYQTKYTINYNVSSNK